MKLFHDSTMEVSNEIKEDIRKTQSELKNAIRVHQVWVARLRDDVNNTHLKTKVLEAEKEIIAIGQTQKLVVERLRRELELYQQRLKAKNKQINIENDNHLVAQQLRDHLAQYRNRNRSVSLLKGSVLNEIQIKTENCNEVKDSLTDSENDTKLSEKENSNLSDGDERYPRNFSQLSNDVRVSRNNYDDALSKVKAVFIGTKTATGEWPEQSLDSDSSRGAEISPTPSPPPLPGPGDVVTQEAFLRLLGLVTPSQKETIEKKRSERRKRATTSTNRNDFLYGNFDMVPKRKKYNQFPYLQTPNDPPQTRSAKLRKQQSQNKSSREGSPSGSSTENKGSNWNSNKPAWAASLPPSLTVEPVFPQKKVCQVCDRSDVPSLLAWCGACAVWQHTGCGAAGRCAVCAAPLRPAPPDPAHRALHHVPEKLIERRALQEKNIKLCIELRKLEARAANLKASLDEHNAEKRQLLADQINTQRNLQKLLDFISHFKETSVSIRSTSASESSSEISKGNEE